MTGRFFLILLALGLCWSAPSPARAGWWFGSDSAWEKSGLDLHQGYDENTVISLSGTVVEISPGQGREPALAVVESGGERVSLVLGPGDYWREQGLELRPGDVVSARGSKALGKDGVAYLMVQNIARAGDSREIALRQRDTGRPAWSGGQRPMHQRPMPMRQMRGGGRNH